jgi:peptide/nickel transport system permease protein
MLSRMIWGGRTALLIALLPTLVAALISLVLGMVAGFYGRWFSGVIMRVMDVLFAFPLVLLAIALGAVLGPGANNLVIVIIVLLVPYMTRTVYVEVVQAKSSEYVAAAMVAGSGRWKLLVQELLPNVSGPLIVMATISAGSMIWVGAGLSFLGLGSSRREPIGAA